jgi:hypothetical protein
MRVLILLFVLFSMPALAGDLQLAQSDAVRIELQRQQQEQLELQRQIQRQNATQQQQQWDQERQREQQKYPKATTLRHPGDFCCRHCRAGELPCGNGCLPKGSQVCLAKATCSCSGKP